MNWQAKKKRKEVITLSWVGSGGGGGGHNQLQIHKINKYNKVVIFFFLGGGGGACGHFAHSGSVIDVHVVGHVIRSKEGWGLGCFNKPSQRLVSHLRESAIDSPCCVGTVCVDQVTPTGEFCDANYTISTAGASASLTTKRDK